MAGTTDKAKGLFKEGVGKATGDKRTEREGKSDRAKGESEGRRARGEREQQGRTRQLQEALTQASERAGGNSQILGCRTWRPAR